MQNVEIQQKLNDYMNKSWLVNTSVHLFRNFSVDDKETVIATDKVILKYRNGEILKKLKDFLPVETAVVEKYNPSNNFPTLEKTVLETIEKLKGKDGEKYIKQSAAINNSVKTMIEIGKLQVAIKKSST